LKIVVLYGSCQALVRGTQAGDGRFIGCLCGSEEGGRLGLLSGGQAERLGKMLDLTLQHRSGIRSVLSERKSGAKNAESK
jgi:hypothetical protein